MPYHTTPIQHYTEIFNQCKTLFLVSIRQEKEIKGVQVGKKHTDDMIYVENSKEPAKKEKKRKTLELISKYRKLIGYKINI